MLTNKTLNRSHIIVLTQSYTHCPAPILSKHQMWINLATSKYLMSPCSIKTRVSCFNFTKLQKLYKKINYRFIYFYACSHTEDLAMLPSLTD